MIQCRFFRVLCRDGCFEPWKDIAKMFLRLFCDIWPSGVQALEGLVFLFLASVIGYLREGKDRGEELGATHFAAWNGSIWVSYIPFLSSRAMLFGWRGHFLAHHPAKGASCFQLSFPCHASPQCCSILPRTIFPCPAPHIIPSRWEERWDSFLPCHTLPRVLNSNSSNFAWFSCPHHAPWTAFAVCLPKEEKGLERRRPYEEMRAYNWQRGKYMDIIREERRSNPECPLLKLHSDEERTRGQLKLEETDAKNGEDGGRVGYGHPQGRGCVEREQTLKGRMSNDQRWRWDDNGGRMVTIAAGRSGTRRWEETGIIPPEISSLETETAETPNVI